MKKYNRPFLKLFFIAMISMLIIGCQKDNNTNQNSKNFDEIENLSLSHVFYNYINNPQTKVLDFATIQDLETTINTLLTLNNDELINWYDTRGVVSQQMLYNDAITELNHLQSMDEILKYKEKYSPFFLFNEKIEDEDLSPYLPSSKVGYSYVCNMYGNVRINGEELNFNDIKSFEETTYGHFLRNRTKGVSSWDNYLYSESSKRKFWAEVRRSGDQIKIEFTAHKKNMFGWNKYATVYIIQTTEYDPNCWGSDKPWNITVESGNGYQVYNTPELNPHSLFYLGKHKVEHITATDPNTGKPIGPGFDVYTPLKMKMNVSTRGIGGGQLYVHFPTL